MTLYNGRVRFLAHNFIFHTGHEQMPAAMCLSQCYEAASPETCHRWSCHTQEVISDL